MTENGEVVQNGVRSSSLPTVFLILCMGISALPIYNLVDRADAGRWNGIVRGTAQMRSLGRVRKSFMHWVQLIKYIFDNYGGGIAMKKMGLCFCAIVLAAVVMAGCTHSLSPAVPDDLKNEIQASTFPTVSVHVGYPSYSSADEIVDAATNIYVGTVKEITFEVIDTKTGKDDPSPESISASRMFYTVYTVSVTESVKGDSPSEIKIRRVGGIVGYREDVQYDKLVSSGLTEQYNGIPVISETEDVCSLAVGNKYLFCTSRDGGDSDSVINLTQFAYRIDSDNATAIIKASK